jgi:photosystem II stability/assembly factor-like uncharacterized protein
MGSSLRPSLHLVRRLFTRAAATLLAIGAVMSTPEFARVVFASSSPIAHGENVWVLEDTPKALALKGSDADDDPLTFTIVTGPTHGTLSGIAPAVTYTPGQDYNGPDSFTFKVNDGGSDSNVATVFLNVRRSLWTSNGPFGGPMGRIIVDPAVPAVLYSIDSGTIWKSVDRGANWAPILTDDFFRALAVEPSSTVLYAASGSAPGLRRSLDQGVTWTPSTTGLPSGNAGTPSAVIADPTTPGTAYVAVNAGFYTTHDSGANWTPGGTELANRNVRSLAVDPNDASTLFAGTSGSGVYKSTDSGASWAAVNVGLTDLNVYSLTADTATVDVWYVGTGSGRVFKTVDGGANWTALANFGVAVSALALDPVTAGVIYAGTYYQLLRSVDHGVTWSSRTSAIRYFGFFDVAIDPAQPNTVYVTSDGGPYKSTDGTVSWSSSSTGITNGLTYVVTSEPSPLSPVMYAGLYYGGVYKTTDGGSSWGSSLLPNSGIQAIAIDPLTPTTLYAGSTCGGFSKSNNAGATWTFSGSGLTNACVQAVAIDPSNPATLYAGTPGGIFKSVNAGGNWTAASSGLTTLNVGELAIDPSTPSTLFAGTVSGGVFKSVDAGSTWTAQNSGLPPFSNVSALAVDPTNPNVVYASIFGGVYKSVNGGASWTNSSSGLGSGAVNALLIDPAQPNVVYAGNSTFGVYKSVNAGATWTALPSDGLASRRIYSLGLNGGSLFAGSNGGGLFGLQQTNDAPVADDQPVTTDEGNPKPITLTGSDLDGDPITFSIVTPPAHGTLTGTPPNVTYTPTGIYYGPDSFTFKVNDGTEDSPPGTAWITVNPRFFQVTATVSGSGSGTVSSDDGQIVCPGDCEEIYVRDSSVTFTAAAGANSTFVGWSGACSGSSSCVVSVDDTKTVTGIFNLTGPDLVESSLVNPPAWAAPGSKFDATDTVLNQGTSASGAASTRYYLSFNTVKDAGDKLLTGARAVPELGAGANSPGTKLVTVPSNTAHGVYYLLACADDTSVIVETDEGNNCLASTTTIVIGRPDLIETALSNPPAGVAPGGKFTVTETTANQGTIPAAASSTRYYFSADLVKGAGDVLLTGARPVGILDPGGPPSTGSRTVTVPLGTLSGPYYLLACADDLAKVVELSDANNCLASTTTVYVGTPDLVISSVSNPPAAAAAGSRITIIDTVLNQGDGLAGASSTRYYLSINTVKDGADVLLTGNRSVTALEPTQSNSGSKPVTIPSGTPGAAYYVLACADAASKVTESDEGNNCTASSTTVNVTP